MNRAGIRIELSELFIELGELFSSINRNRDPYSAPGTCGSRSFFQKRLGWLFRVNPRCSNSQPPSPSVSFLFFWYISFIQLTPHKLRAKPRNSASAEALAVARRPKEASSEKTRPPPVSRGSSS